MRLGTVLVFFVVFFLLSLEYRSLKCSKTCVGNACGLNLMQMPCS